MSGRSIQFVNLTDRGVLRIGGPDARNLLQGLITVDLDKLQPDNALYGALLTPQGKYLFDFLIAQQGDDILLDSDGDRFADLKKKLELYRLRSDVEITDISDSCPVTVLFGDGAEKLVDLPASAGAARRLGDGVVFIDPRTPAMGARILGPKSDISLDEAKQASLSDYDAWRIGLGIPAGGRDLLVDKSYILECNFDELHGVDFRKGCFIGQELTARMKHRASLRKRLYPVKIDGEIADDGAIEAEGRNVGEIRSRKNSQALAMIRTEAAEAARRGDTRLTSGNAQIELCRPVWDG